MLPKNTQIATLRTIVETSGQEPEAWRVFQLDDDSYELQFTYDEPKKYWLPVSLRSGKQKPYKSLNAIFNDINKITRQAVIHFHWK